MDSIKEKIRELQAETDKAIAKADDLESRARDLEYEIEIKELTIVSLERHLEKSNEDINEFSVFFTNQSACFDEYRADADEAARKITALQLELQDKEEKFIACRAELDKLTHRSDKLQ